MNLEKYRQIFFDETTEDLNTLESLILRVEESPFDKEAIRSIFRLFHRLKSSSAMMGLTHFSELSHRAEDLLSLINEAKIAIGKSVTSLLLSVVDTMRRLITEAETGNIAGFNPEELLEKLKDLSKEEGKEEKGLSLQNISDLKEISPEVPAVQIHQGLNVVRINEAERSDRHGRRVDFNHLGIGQGDPSSGSYLFIERYTDCESPHHQRKTQGWKTIAEYTCPAP